MLQVYFLLVLTNVILGLILFVTAAGDRLPESLLSALENRSLQKSFGLISVVVGFLGLIAVLPGDLPILGNLLPAATSMVIGMAVFLGPPSEELSLPPWAASVQEFIYRNATVFGSVCLVFALLHFIFPQALFL